MPPVARNISITAKEPRNAATQINSSQEVIVWESPPGTIGLKPNAIATNPTAHRGIPGRIVPKVTGITPAQRTISRKNSGFAEERHNPARSTAVMDAHIIITESNGNLVSRLSRYFSSHSHGHSYRRVVRASVQHCSHLWSQLLSQERPGTADDELPGFSYPAPSLGGRFAGEEPAGRRQRLSPFNVPRSRVKFLLRYWASACQFNFVHLCGQD